MISSVEIEVNECVGRAKREMLGKHAILRDEHFEYCATLERVYDLEGSWIFAFHYVARRRRFSGDRFSPYWSSRLSVQVDAQALCTEVSGKRFYIALVPSMNHLYIG